MQNTRIRFFDLARLKRQIDADSEIPLRELHQRDSEIAKQINASSPIPRLLAWLRYLESTPSTVSLAPTPHHLEGFIIFWLIVIGLAAGIMSMSGVLFANNQQPVNILLFLALFVGVQMLLFLISVISAFVPFSQDRLSSPLVFLNPAALMLKRSLRHLSNTMPWDTIPQLTRLAILRWSQALGVAFNIALLGTLLLVLAISDRSFGWSSTLNFSDDALLRLLEGLSSPWSWLGNGASVNAELVNSTRFQSLQNQFNQTQVEAMRQWWPFLFASIVCYGLLPRLVLLILFQQLLKKAIRHTFLQYPGTALVLDRLATPFVSTHEQQLMQQKENNVDDKIQTSLPSGCGFAVINWAGAINDVDIQLAKLGIKPHIIFDGGFNLQDDKDIISSIKQRPEPIMIAVKSWEPPLAELKDFMMALNAKSQTYLLLMPLNEKPISKNEMSDWQHFIKQSLQSPVHLVRGDESTEESSLPNDKAKQQ